MNHGCEIGGRQIIQIDRCICQCRLTFNVKLFKSTDASVNLAAIPRSITCLAGVPPVRIVPEPRPQHDSQTGIGGCRRPCQMHVA